MTRYRFLLWLFLVAYLTGCGENESIRTETVPKPTAEAFDPKVRLLAAILEQNGDQWFFKLVGPTAEVSKFTEAFATFVQSVRFTGKADEPIQWTVPPGWETGPKKELRYATFFLAGKDKLPELSVFKFDRISPLLDNVNRWCRVDLGRTALRERDLKKVTQSRASGRPRGHPVST
jgi:hypothetical protein